MTSAMAVRIEPWASGDLPLLQRLMGDPVMMAHLGGPESEEKIANRQTRYEQMSDPAVGQAYRIVDAETGLGVGWVGYWEREEHGEMAYETGWSVLPEYQGRGIAGQATALVIEATRAQRTHRYLYAYPGVDNAASNAICRKLGFALIDTGAFEYPAGSYMQCNVWRLDLTADAPTSGLHGRAQVT